MGEGGVGGWVGEGVCDADGVLAGWVWCGVVGMAHWIRNVRAAWAGCW